MCVPPRGLISRCYLPQRKRGKKEFKEVFFEQNMLTTACFMQGNPPFSQRISLGSLWLNKKRPQNSHFCNFKVCLASNTFCVCKQQYNWPQA